MPYSWYNSTSSDPLSFFRYVISVEPLTFPVILVVIWIVLAISMMKFGFARAFTIASFISTLLSIFIVLMSLMTNHIMIVFIIMTAIGVLWLKIEGSNEGI